MKTAIFKDDFKLKQINKMIIKSLEIMIYDLVVISDYYWLIDQSIQYDLKTFFEIQFLQKCYLNHSFRHSSFRKHDYKKIAKEKLTI